MPWKFRGEPGTFKAQGSQVMRPVPQASPRGNAISAASGDKRCGAALTQPTPAKLSGVNRLC